jgi:hypothetical protein
LAMLGSAESARTISTPDTCRNKVEHECFYLQVPGLSHSEAIPIVVSSPEKTEPLRGDRQRSHW